MVQFKALTTIFIATTIILPSLAVPVSMQGSGDLVSREYDDSLVERAVVVEPLLTREIGDEIELEARDPKLSFGGFFKAIGKGLGKVAGAILRRRELDDTDDLLARDYAFEEDLD